MPQPSAQSVVTNESKKPIHPAGQVRTDEADSSLPPDQGDMASRVQALRLNREETDPHRGRSRSRRWFWLFMFLLVIAAVLFKLRDHRSGRAGLGPFGGARDVDYVTATSESSVDVVLDTTGYVGAASTARVSFNIHGTISELAVEEGQEVTAGQLLAQLDNTQYLADLEQAKAGLAAAKALLAEARKGARDEEIEQARSALEQAESRHELLTKEYERAKQLRDTISPAEYDRVEANFEDAEAMVDQAQQGLRLLELGPREEQITAFEAEVERAKAMHAKAQYFVECTRLVSPVSGTVVERSVTLGETVLPQSVLNTQFVIADLSRLEVEIEIQEQDLADVEEEQPCLVTTEAFPDREYQGRLAWFSPVFNRQRGICRAKVEILDPDRKLMPDMNCRVRVLGKGYTGELTERIELPPEAINREAAATFVFVLDNGAAHRCEVELGPETERGVEILDGLRGGETVLLPGEKPLTEGQRVRLRESSGDSNPSMS